MTAFDIIDTTLRAGNTVDQVEFEVTGAPPAIGYMLGRQRGESQPVAIALHDERGDKATLLPDLEVLAARGFLCLSIDSPQTRRAMSERDPLSAFDAYFRIALAALNLLQGDPDTLEHQVAMIGRGIGGEAAAAIAAHTGRCQVVVAIASLPDRSSFIEHSSHPLAAGLRQFHSAENLRRQIDGLARNALIRQLDTAPDTQWLLQIATDDDRLSDTDRQVLTMSIPRSARVRTHQTMSDLAGTEARRERLDFVTSLCGRFLPRAG